MHRNTLIVVSILAVVAALLTGFNVGKRLATPGQPVSVTPTPQTTPKSPSPAATTSQRYTNTYCGITFDYPSTLTKLDNASGSALLTNAQQPDQSIAIACQEDIPRSPLTDDKIESVTIWNTAKTASISARLYHDASSRDGTPIDALIFYHPTKRMDVFIGGYGAIFNELIKTVSLL